MSKPNIYDKLFSMRMKKIINEHSGSVASFAQKLGVTPPTVTRWIKGEADPTRTNLIKIAETVGVSLEWLATGMIEDKEMDFAHSETKPKTETEKLQQAIDTLQEVIKNKKNQEVTQKVNIKETRLLEFFRKCSEDRKAALLSSAEVLAELTLNEQKESQLPLEIRQVA